LASSFIKLDIDKKIFQYFPLTDIVKGNNIMISKRFENDFKTQNAKCFFINRPNQSFINGQN
jgi:hypothetical protein